MKRSLLSAALLLGLAGRAGAADVTDDATPQTTRLSEIHVAASRTARNDYAPELGSSSYTLDRTTIDALPLGDSTPVNQVLLRAPGVVQDSYGQLHIRGDHANIQYRINGVLLPTSIGGFGQSLDTHIVESMQLLTGALPAQYGYRTAGVVEITTRSGEHLDNGGSAGVTAGSFGTWNPNLSLHGHEGGWSYFFSASYLQNDIGIENPTSSRKPVHDHSNQRNAFGLLSYAIAPHMHLDIMAGVTNNRFDIPDNPLAKPAFDYLGRTTFDASTLNERQREITRFGVLALHGRIDETDYQVALSQRYSGVDFHPDDIGDLMFNGIASRVRRGSRATGLQADFSTSLGDTHTLSYGMYFNREKATSDNDSLVFPAGPDGHQSSGIPVGIRDDQRIVGHQYTAYVQDSWTPFEKLTVNIGARADRNKAYLDEGQVSPRASMSYRFDDDTTAHIAYARYFTPAPTELVAPANLHLYDDTTNQLSSTIDSRVKAERSDYYDIGVQHRFTPALTVGLDAYHREAKHLQDEGQFGAALIYLPFNYAKGRIRGVELSVNYDSGPWSAFFNLAQQRTKARQLTSGQYNFQPDDLAYIATHWVHLDHEQRLTSSGGVSYAFAPDWKLAADYLFGSGLRRDGNGVPNGAHMPGYFQLNASLSHHFGVHWDARLAVINALDRGYQLRDGTGIGVGAPQFGPRRGYYASLERSF